MFQKNTKQNKSKNNNKPGFGLLFVIILLVCTTLFAPYKPAQAQFAAYNTTVFDWPREWSEALKKSENIVSTSISNLLQVALINAIDYYIQNLAYETATRIATGSPGQQPLVYGKPIWQGIKDAGDAALGDFMDDLSRNMFGQSLCQPANPQVKLLAVLKVEQQRKPPKPSCSLSQIQTNLGITAGRLDDLNDSLRNLSLRDTVRFSGYFAPEQNDIGTIISTQNLALQRQQEGESEEEKEREQGEGFKDNTNVTGEEVKTPASVIRGWYDAVQRQALQKQTPEKPNTGSAVLTVLARGLLTFGKTFIGAWTQELFEQGISRPAQGPSDAQFISGTGGIAAARQYYSKLIQQDFASSRELNITSQLATCPGNLRAQLWNNCIITQNMKQAIDEEVTLKQAIDSGYIKPGLLFGYNKQADDALEWNNGLPYNSLVVMRKYRIVPVGWELAAQYIKDVMRVDDHGGQLLWTISDVMNCYEDPENPNDNRFPAECRIDPKASCDGSAGSSAPECVNPFYHLVNPNWVLKAPHTVCYREGPGPEIAAEPTTVQVPETSFGIADPTDISYREDVILSRHDWCAAEMDCIQEGPNGECDWEGYCVEEKSIWRFTAPSCPAVFNSCQSLAKVEGAYGQQGTGSTEIGYLTRTMEDCSVGDVGCGWYSTAFDTTNNTWEGSNDINGNGSPDRVYLNNEAEGCSSDDAGCSLFYKARDNSDPIAARALLSDLHDQVRNNLTTYSEAGNIEPVYMKKAPANLDCSYTNPNKPAACDDYALECGIDAANNQLGCMFYTPLNGDPKIPARIQPGDACNEQCVGFGAFTYVGSWFEDAEDDNLINNSTAELVNMVPTTGQQCTQAGCEAFTNLDDVAAGGEGIEYYTRIRQCVTPGTSGTKTYFTWEGSDTSGYQLKRWVMLEGSGGAPCTGVVPGDPESCAATTACTDTSNPACRSFFDDGGNTYLADINQVIYADEDCTALRRESSGVVYFGIPNLSQSCQAQNAGCREYKGAGANNVRIISVDSFEPQDVTDTSGGLLFGWSGGSVSSESLELNGTSMAFNTAEKDVSTQVKVNKLYTITFFAKGSSANFRFEGTNLTAPVDIGSVSLGPEWQVYTIGPAQLPVPPGNDMRIVLSGGGFIDNIVIRETTDNYLLIKDSWDQTLANTCLANNDFNCKLYQPDQGDVVALKSFSELCEDKYVGCVAMIDTHNSANDAAERVWNTENDDGAIPETLYDNYLVPRDETVYIVDNPSAYCNASEKGCQLVGRPVFDRTQITEEVGGDFSGPVVTEFRETAIIVDPDTFNRTLCTEDAQFCSLYTDNDGTQKAFIDPGNRVCEYIATSSQGKPAGWYRSGTDTVCDPLTSGVVGDPRQPVPSSDVNYQGWVGLCPQEQSSCSQLLDPEASSGQSVYYLLMDQFPEEDIAACSQEGGVVNREAGCRLFADTENYLTSRELYTASAYDPFLSENYTSPQSSTDENPVGSGVYPNNSTNILLKVQPDRVCSEFMYCTSELSLTNFSNNSDARANLQSVAGSSNAICLGIGKCSELDASGRCVGRTAEVLQRGDVGDVQPAAINNSQPSTNQSYLANVSVAGWATGKSKYGAVWPQGSVGGLYPYHLMPEIGSPISIPNSNFEDRDNFAKEYSSWPLVENARIVGRTSGVYPYEGSSMLEMQLTTTERVTSVTSAPLPVSPQQETVVSLYVNFKLLNAANVGICAAGHNSRIGNSCTQDSDCNNSSNICSGIASIGYCRNQISGSYPQCSSPTPECGGLPCVEWQCAGGPNTNESCNPNQGTVPGNPACNDTVNNIQYTCRAQKDLPPSTRTCTDGDVNKIGSACTVNSDCAVNDLPGEGDLCQPVGSILKVQIVDGDDPDTVLEEFDVPKDIITDWRQRSFDFAISAASDTFRVRLYAALPAGEDNGGSILIDNVEIRSGLKINDSTIVAPSCRLYPRTQGTQTDALSCEYTERGTVTGQPVASYKGWRGYCIEEVPDKPGVCMQWWPVDAIQGDVNFFGQGAIDDIEVNGATPATDIYYCAHSTGDLANTGVLESGVCIDSETIPTLDCSSFLNDVDCDGAFRCAWDADISECRETNESCSVFTSESVCSNDSRGACMWDAAASRNLKQPYYYQAGTAKAWGDAVFGTYSTRLFVGGIDGCDSWEGLGNGTIDITFGGCARNCSDWSRYPCSNVVDASKAEGGFPEGNLHKSQIQTIVMNLANNNKNHVDWVYLDRDVEYTSETAVPQNTHEKFVQSLFDGETAWFVDCNRSNPPRGNNGRYCDSADHWLAVGVIFDVDGYVNRYWYAMDDYSTDGKSEGAAWVVGYYLRDMCLTLVRANTSYGARVPWVSRFNDGSDAVVIEKERDQLPFGSVAPPTYEYTPDDEAEDNPWLGDPLFAVSGTETLYCGDRLQAQSCARLGTPYSCVGNCGQSVGRVCIAGPNDVLGLPCQTNNDCTVADLPQSKGLCGGVAGDMSFDSGTPYSFDVGIGRLSQLFAKSQAIYGWDFVNEKYVRCDGAGDLPSSCFWPNSANPPGETSQSVSWPPIFGPQNVLSKVVAEYDITGCGAPGFSYNGTKICSGIDSTGKAPRVQDFLINSSNQDVTIISGDYVTMQFFPNVNRDRVPLKAVRVNWGDDTYYKPNQDLSNLAGQGLPISTYYFVHHYFCGGSGSTGWDNGLQACVFTPSVQLKDNWGWCSADAANPGGIYQCSADTGFTEFSGRILVRPNDFRAQLPEVQNTAE